MRFVWLSKQDAADFSPAFPRPAMRLRRRPSPGSCEMTTSELLQLQRKAERQMITGYEPDFTVDVRQIEQLSEWSAREANADDADRALARPRRDLLDLAALLSPPALERIEAIARAAQRLTQQRFGRTMRMFAPLYLSNECVSECTYCGFQVWNRDIVRRTLSDDDVRMEARYLTDLGFRHLLLVAGEHPKHVSAEYIASCVAAAAGVAPNVSVEVQVWDEAAYRSFVDAGCDGLVVYQEVYDPRIYPRHHLKGNKRFFGWRLGAPERAARAGMRRLGIGTLVGLNPDWRFEVLALASHAKFLMRTHWRRELTVALPRLEPAAGVDDVPAVMSDAELALAIAALRLALPDAGIVLSTREPPRLRDGLSRLGVTHMSAGSRTEPGGYTAPGSAQEQFEVSDERPTSEVAARLVAAGLSPVWKDATPSSRPPSAAGGGRL
jgi:2-iminoacetate synthase